MFSDNKEKTIAIHCAGELSAAIGNVKPSQEARRDTPCYLKWMCENVVRNSTVWSIARLHRWIGWIQCDCVNLGITTLDEERARIRRLYEEVEEVYEETEEK